MTEAIGSRQFVPQPNTDLGSIQPNNGQPPAPPVTGPVAQPVVTAANLPPLADAQVQHAQRRPQVFTALVGHIRTGLAAFGDAVRSAFMKSPSIPQSVQIQVGENNVTINKDQYEPMIKALPKSQRSEAIANLAQTLTDRVRDGLAVKDAVLNGTAQARNIMPSAQNVSNLILALYATAAEQNEAFTNGSFSVADPQGRLAQWLDTSADVYVRSSSHLKTYQHMTVDGHLNMQRGIDIQPGPTTGLPNGHRTVAYGTIPDYTTNGNGDRRRLFVKTESAGCRLSTVSSSDIAAATSANMTIRDWHASDIKDVIMHGKSYLETRGQQGSTAARKEHFPTPVKQAFDAAVAKFTAVDPNLASLLTDGGPHKGGGVCMLRRNMDVLYLVLQDSEMPAGQLQQLNQALDELNQAINSMLHHDRLDIRLGNEVLID